MSGKVVGDLLTDILYVDRKRISGSKGEYAAASTRGGESIRVISPAIERVLHFRLGRHRVSQLFDPHAGVEFGGRQRVVAIREPSIGIVSDRSRHSESVFVIGEVSDIARIRKRIAEDNNRGEFGSGCRSLANHVGGAETDYESREQAKTEAHNRTGKNAFPRCADSGFGVCHSHGGCPFEGNVLHGAILSQRRFSDLKNEPERRT